MSLHPDNLEQHLSQEQKENHAPSLLKENQKLKKRIAELESKK